MIQKNILKYILIIASASILEGADFNVRDFGAKGDGKTNDATAITAAIDKCAASGGGAVKFDKGIFVTSTIFLKGNVTLEICKEATIKGSENLNEYSAYPANKVRENERFESTGKPWWNNSIISAHNIENVKIMGGGTIDGGHLEDPRGEEGMRGPHSIFFSKVKNFEIRDIKFKRASNYAFMAFHIDGGKFENLHFEEGWDGIHFRHGKNVVINKCEFYTGDDCIAGGEWENVIIQNCLMNSSCNGFRLIMAAKNVTLKNLKIYGDGKFAHRTSRGAKRRTTYSALVIQPSAWSTVEGDVENILIEDVEIDNVQCAFLMSTCKKNTIKNVYVKNLKARNVGNAPVSVENWRGISKRPIFKDAKMIGGEIERSQPGEIENITFENVSISYKGFANTFKNEALDVPICDCRALPVWGFFAKNVNNLTLVNVKLTTENFDARRAFRFDKVENLNIKDFTAGDEKSLKKISLSPENSLPRVK